MGFPDIWLPWGSAAEAELPGQRTCFYLGIYQMFAGPPFPVGNCNTDALYWGYAALKCSTTSAASKYDSGVILNRYEDRTYVIRMIDSMKVQPRHVIDRDSTYNYPPPNRGRPRDLHSTSYSHITSSKLEATMIPAAIAAFRELLDRSQRPVYLLYCIQHLLKLSIDGMVAVCAIAIITLATPLNESLSSVDGALGVALRWKYPSAPCCVFGISNLLRHPRMASPITWMSFPHTGLIKVLLSSAMLMPSSITPEFTPRDINWSTHHGPALESAVVPGQEEASPLTESISAASHFRLSQSESYAKGTDETIITVLETVGLWTTIEARGDLCADASIPLSAGERQVFALAYALLLRKSLQREGGILVLDEVFRAPSRTSSRRLIEAGEPGSLRTVNFDNFDKEEEFSPSGLASLHNEKNLPNTARLGDFPKAGAAKHCRSHLALTCVQLETSKKALLNWRRQEADVIRSHDHIAGIDVISQPCPHFASDQR
ncbi:uncharacterized protein BDR25DRAFT_361471 [Lindgomyces ingoldianus]|uniref:Uncharacterized protein n=1 Tax=Lindgomyces ingoldianus TaxID=673940 RepID=A0ACB6QE45_9PLEO|nr:uncharacterized protein BDR25DRAFT_361471 [Lindgomyces ingoldianus]KAF2464637.1 hypothetical protein BDR25DRAFT_361471 [Lindgomyces ingoldianus]